MRWNAEKYDFVKAPYRRCFHLLETFYLPAIIPILAEGDIGGWLRALDLAISIKIRRGVPHKREYPDEVSEEIKG